MREFPNCSLSEVFNGYGAFEDLEFLQYLSNISDLSISLDGAIDLSPINKYCNLKSLAIGGDKSRIGKITTHNSIENLFVFGKIKDVQSIGQMKQLKRLTISTIQHLAPINSIESLKEITFNKQPHLLNLTWLKNKNIKIEIINCRNFKDENSQ